MSKHSDYCLSLQKIIVQCEEQKSFPERVFLKSNAQWHDSHDRQMKKSIKRLSNAEEENYDEETIEVGERVKEEARGIRNRLLRLKKGTCKAKVQIRRHKSQGSANKKSGPSKLKISLLQLDSTSLPSLLRKVRSQKEPKNASNSISVSPKESTRRSNEDSTYEFIRRERKRNEQIRHLTILGKVMSQNYRKQIRLVETRKKLLIKNREFT